MYYSSGMFRSELQFGTISWQLLKHYNIAQMEHGERKICSMFDGGQHAVSSNWCWNWGGLLHDGKHTRTLCVARLVVGLYFMPLTMLFIQLFDLAATDASLIKNYELDLRCREVVHKIL